MLRTLNTKLVQLFQKFPVVFLTGPRQSGKTTLSKMTFPDLPYVNFEDISVLEKVKADPHSFLDQYDNGLIIDEAQNMPDIFSYIQVYADQREKPGQFLLSGSQNFLLNEHISQSLAGRVGILELLPLSYNEIRQEHDFSVSEVLFKGGYPRIYKYDIDSEDFFPGYLRTYVERDVRSLKNILSLEAFQRLLILCAGRVGQVLNFSSLSNDTGLSINTLKSWISILEASYIVYLIHPYFVNINKRLIKAPKIYFYDTGLLCHLLGIHNEVELKQHYAYGNIFENFVINEIRKRQLNNGERANMYFMRDSRGHEIDCVIPKGNKRLFYEIKASATFNNDFVKNINYFRENNDGCAVIYQGKEDSQFKGTLLKSIENFLMKESIDQ